MSLLQVKLKASSKEELKEQIKEKLNDLDEEELTNLKWFLITRKEDESIIIQTQKEKKFKNNFRIKLPKLEMIRDNKQKKKTEEMRKTK